MRLSEIFYSKQNSEIPKQGSFIIYIYFSIVQLVQFPDSFMKNWKLLYDESSNVQNENSLQSMMILSYRYTTFTFNVQVSFLILPISFLNQKRLGFVSSSIKINKPNYVPYIH